MSGVLTLKSAIPISMNDSIVLKEESPDVQANSERGGTCNCSSCMNHVALTMVNFTNKRVEYFQKKIINITCSVLRS